VVPGSSKPLRLCEQVPRWQNVANRDFGWEVAHATPADFPRHDGAPYRGLRARRWGLGFDHRSRPFSVAPCQTFAYDSQRFFHGCGCASRARWATRCSCCWTARRGRTPPRPQVSDRSRLGSHGRHRVLVTSYFRYLAGAPKVHWRAGAGDPACEAQPKLLLGACSHCLPPAKIAAPLASGCIRFPLASEGIHFPCVCEPTNSLSLSLSPSTSGCIRFPLASEGIHFPCVCEPTNSLSLSLSPSPSPQTR
jgi:hypothetical protein